MLTGTTLARWRTPRAWWAIWLAVGLSASLASVAIGGAVGDVLYVGISVAAPVAIAGAILRRRADRLGGWLIITAGLVLFALGEAAFVALAWSGIDEFPTVADALYVLGYPVFLLGLLAVMRETSRARSGVLLDALILMTSVGSVFWIVFIRPYLGDPSLEPVAVAVSIAYPLGDLALLGVLARVLLGPARNHSTFRLLAVGTLAYLVADLVYAGQSLTGTYVEGPVDLGWMVGYTMWAAAGMHPGMASRVAPAVGLESLSRIRLGLLATSVGVPVVVAVADWRETGRLDLALFLATAAVSFLVLFRLAGIVHTFRELLAQRAALQEQLRRQALQDPLTELPNRRMLVAEIRAAAETARAGGYLLLLDVDDFKTVNDSLGHPAGDSVLVAVGRRIRGSLRSTELVARLGGDEYAVFAPEGTRDDAQRTALRIVNALAQPIAVGGRPISVHASIGVALRQDDEHAESLLRNADIAMYKAKGRGKDRVEFYDAALHGVVAERLQMRSQLESAVARGEFVVAFQPIVTMATGEVFAREALLRWRHPERGVLSPGAFLAAADESQLIVPLDRWVLQEACRAAAAWRARGSQIRVSVNVSPKSLSGPDFAQTVRDALASTGLPPFMLTLEIIEGELPNVEGAAAVLEQLRRTGVHVSLDDFGTGYSSLDRIARLAVDEVKIDRAFVTTPVGGVEERLLGAMVQVATSLGIRVIGEGIETAGQAERLVELGCVYGQGYHYGAPALAASPASSDGSTTSSAHERRAISGKPA